MPQVKKVKKKKARKVPGLEIKVLPETDEVKALKKKMTELAKKEAEQSKLNSEEK